MRKLKSNILSPWYLNLNTKIFMHEADALGFYDIYPQLSSHVGRIFLNYSSIAITESVNILKKYYLKFVFAVITFLGIYLIEKVWADAYLISSVATAVFIVPFVEEFGKFISLKYRFAGFFIILFIGIESYIYISHSSYLLGWNDILLARFLACVIHLTTLYFQWIARVYSEKNNKQNHVTAAYFLSVFIHGAWNYGM